MAWQRGWVGGRHNVEAFAFVRPFRRNWFLPKINFREWAAAEGTALMSSAWGKGKSTEVCAVTY